VVKVSNHPKGNVKLAELNATQGSLLGFLHAGPKTGWDLLREVEGGLDRFWNITSSHVYRELRALEVAGLVAAGEPGRRERRPFSITPAGRRAFRTWIAEPTGPEQIRFPLLVKLWFGSHLDADTLAAFLDTSRVDHQQRLSFYRDVEHTLRPDDDRMSVILFGIAYEQAVLGWLDQTAGRQGLSPPSVGQSSGPESPSISVTP
jgi:DNA-binding PadR family transcriptional regulator